MKKVCLILVLSVVVLSLLVVPAYAISYTDVHFSNGSGFGGGSRDDGADTVLSFKELSALCDEVNSALSRGYYTDFSGYEAKLYQIVGSEYSYYIIKAEYSGATCTLYNSADQLVRTAYVTNSHDYYDYLADIIDALDAVQTAIGTVSSYVNSISGKLDTIATSVSNIVQTNSRLANLERITGNIYMQLIDDEESPLLLRLDAIKNAIENITISADNLTIEAYDDTLVLGNLASIKSNVSTAASYTGQLFNLTYNTLTPFIAGITNKLNRLDQLSASGDEVPSTLYDYISMVMVPAQQNILDEVTALFSTVKLIRSYSSSILSKVNSIAQNSTNSMNYLFNISTSIGKGNEDENIITLLKPISKITNYDDTSVIAAVNAVESTLSNLSITSEVNTDLTPVIASIGAVGLNVEALNTYFNTDLNANLGSLVDKLDVVIEGSSESLENRINVVIDQENNAYNIFYVTGEDGETQSVTEFAGDLTEASGRLLSLLYRLVFADALSGVDGDLDAFENFYSDTGDSAAGTQSVMEGAVNVWQ